MPVVYEQLRKLASRCLRAERPDHTLRATALVHEAYVRLVDSDVAWQDRVHFFAVSARMLRRILVDHAKATIGKAWGWRGEGFLMKPCSSDRRRQVLWNWMRHCIAWRRTTSARAN